MTSIADLFDKAEAARDAERYEFSLCLDRELAARCRVARAAVDQAKAKADLLHEQQQRIAETGERPAGRKKLSDTTGAAEQQAAETISEAEQALREAEDAARPSSVIFLFRVLSGDTFLPMIARHSTVDGHVDIQKLGSELLPACWDRAISANTGEELEMAWERASKFFTGGDLSDAAAGIALYHSARSAVPFARPTSAMTSSSA